MSSSIDNPTLIAVLGVTGAGKTTFISRATGRTDLTIGHGLLSCTQEISLSTFTINGKKVTLIDTPGFDDTDKSDANILQLIAKYLTDTYSHGVLLTGIILLQPINTNRVGGSETRRTRLFEKVCGPNAYSSVVIATTMWSDVTSEVGIARVSQRREAEDFWGKMVNGGARTVNHDNTPASAQNIVRMLLDCQPTVLQIQSELAQNDGMVMTTSAGQQLNSDLDNMSRKLLAELQELRQQRDVDLEELRELKDEVNKIKKEKEELKEAKVGWCVIL